MSWKIEIEGASNALRFEAETEATGYGDNLWSRWLGCPVHPVSVKAEDSVTHVWEDGKLRDITQSSEAGRAPARSVQL